MANTPAWFNKDYYLTSKLAQLRAAGETKYNNIVDVAVALEAAGFTAYEHFQQYSLIERTSPNPAFNATEYLNAKAAQLGNGATADSVALAIREAGMNLWEHFQTYGWKEGVNPSNSFDVKKYMESKLAQLQKDEPDAGWTAERLEEVFSNAGIDPVSHYDQFGKSEEGVVVSPAENPVPSDGRTDGKVFTLTTGQDVANVSSDTTVFGLVGTGATFTLGDVINGAAKLNLTSDNADVNLATATITNVQAADINMKAVDLSGAGATAATVNANKVAFKQLVVDGVTGTDGQADTLTLNNVKTATTVVLKNLADVATTVNFDGAGTGTADEVTVEIAGATETAANAGENDLTIDAVETLNLNFTTAANDLDVLDADDAKTVNISVAKGANTNLRSAADLQSATKLNINATGNLTLGGTADLANDAVITVKGSGNVNLNTLEGGKTVSGDSVNAAALTGKLTVVGHTNTASITSGSGADTITSAANTTVVVAGDGNDYVSIGAVDYGAAGAKTVAGGSGRDTLNITASVNLDAGLMANVTGFEVLDIKGSNGTDGAGTGNGNYNIDGLGFEEVTISGALTKAATVSGITNQTLTITANTKGAAAGAGTGVVTYALKTNTATDSLAVTIAGAFDGKGTVVTTDDANDLTVEGIVTNGIETLTLTSNTDAKNVAGVKNTVSKLDATGATKLVVAGDHALEITAFAAGAAVNTTIKTIDASAAKGLIMGATTGYVSTKDVSITGSANADVITVGVVDATAANGTTATGSTINAGKGGDVVRLDVDHATKGDGSTFVGARDTLIYSAGDSQIGYTDTNKDGAYSAAADEEAFDIITGFKSGEDLLDLGAFGFSGQKASALAGASLTEAKAVELVNGTTTSIANFFVDTGVTRGVAVVTGTFGDIGGSDTNDTLVFIDVDGNGNLDTANDMLIVLSGTGPVTLADFGF